MSTTKNATKDVTDALQQMSKLSMDFFNTALQNNLKIANEMGGLFKNIGIELPSSTAANNKNCCPPEPFCPPHCLVEITREAYAGEFIVVPFAIQNTCGSAKRYRIGLRPLVDQDGNPAPIQPTLNRDEINLEPGQSINILMMVNLTQGVITGDCYTMDIVIRENEINQNICFKLFVKPFCNIPTAKPLDEKHYLNHWQGWQSHFYCEQKPEGQTINLRDEIADKLSRNK